MLSDLAQNAARNPYAPPSTNLRIRPGRAPGGSAPARAMEGHVLGQSELMGTYEKKAR
jgi:phosphatidylethanolamine-binding protein (PEBP) family uncharacterized protein